MKGLIAGFPLEEEEKEACQGSHHEKSSWGHPAVSELNEGDT